MTRVQSDIESGDIDVDMGSVTVDSIATMQAFIYVTQVFRAFALPSCILATMGHRTLLFDW